MWQGLVALLLVPGAGLAQDWQVMDGAEVAAALTDRTLIYENATQRFYASGRTLYNAGQDSWGYWAVRGDQYCSQWPPGDQWDCYDMVSLDGVIRFIGADGSTTDGVFAP
ncbi:MAG: hypothetical protein AAFN63_06035 [Pseudomonadota bacterium]